MQTLQGELVGREEGLTTPIKSIRKFCINCQGGNQKAPTFCLSPDCALFAYREGKNPARKGIGGGTRGKELKRSLETIVATQVASNRKIIEVSGHKRIIIEDM